MSEEDELRVVAEKYNLDPLGDFMAEQTEVERLRALNAELLAALKKLVADCSDDEVDQPWTALIEARAAIAKAKGEA